MPRLLSLARRLAAVVGFQSNRKQGESSSMTIPELLEQRAAELGDQTYLICEDVEYSFAAVHEHAARVAVNLAKRGVGKDSKIALLMGNCMEFVYVFLGAGRIGAVTVPVNPMLKPEEIAYIVGNADAEVL